MGLKSKEDYRTREFSFTIEEDSKALVVNFKGHWEDSAYAHYMEKLNEFIGKVNTEIYTLTLRCSEFGISMPELRTLIGPFMQVYKDGGFSHMRVITENPQKLFRSIMKESGEKIGFSMEFCNSDYISQEVYI